MGKFGRTRVRERDCAGAANATGQGTKRGAICLAVGAACSIGTSWAQQPVPGEPQPGRAVHDKLLATAAPASRASARSEDIVVTAQKRKQSIYGVGIAITALSGAQLKKLGVNSVDQLTRVEPSFVFSQSTYSEPYYTIRGVGFNDLSLAASPTVSVYQDEVPFAFPRLSKGATLDVGQVEILKGPQGTLYGQNATGGAVNFLAARPTDSFHAGIEGTYGNFDSSNVNGYVSGPIAPTLNGRGSFDISEGGAYQKSDTRSATLGDKDLKKFRALLDWTPSSDLKVSLNLNGFTDSSDTLAEQFIGTDLSSPKFANRVPAVFAQPLSAPNDQSADWYSKIRPHDDETFFEGSLRADYTVSDAMLLTYLGSYQQFEQDNLLDPTGEDTDVSILDAGSVIATSQELRASGAVLDDRLKWIIGADYALADTKENQLIDLLGATTAYAYTPFGVPPFAAIRDVSRDHSQSGAAFGNLEYRVLPNLSVHGGARFTRTDIDHEGCTQDVDGNGAAGTNALEKRVNRAGPFVPAVRGGCDTLGPSLTPEIVRQSLDENNASWRVGVDWTPFEKSLIYASITKGYKAGSFPTQPASSYLTLAPAKQEALLSYEVGFKSRFYDNRIQLSGDYFHYDYSDKQLQLREPDPNHVFGLLNTLLNVPKSTEDGVEVSGRILPVDGLSLTGAATYIDSRIDGRFVNYSPLSSVPVNIGGEPFPDVPRWALRAGSEYDFEVSDRVGAFVGASYRYQSRTIGAFGTANSEQLGFASYGIRNYFILDLRAGLNSSDGHWHMQVFGNNVTNTYYWTQVARNVDVIVRYPGLPTTYGLTVGYTF